MQKTIVKTTLAVLVGALLISCNRASNQEEYSSEEYPNTSHPYFEDKINPRFASEIIPDPNKVYFVLPARLNVRSGPGTKFDILGVLNRNDEVIVLQNHSGEYAEIEIVKSVSVFTGAEHYYISKKYLSPNKATANQSKGSKDSSEYFMVQNLATEVVRIYKRSCNSCAHKLIFEENIAVGEEANRDTQTAVGYFHISSWSKFYQDGAGSYPSWYDPKYPSLPPAGSSYTKWISNKVMPYKSASARGAFGWYTAKVAPNSRYQWTHGTIGWGADKSTFIEISRKFFANLFADPRSHGCTRTNNEAIAYIRQMLPTGSAIIKIYAKEAYADLERVRYNQQSEDWDYILTTNGVRRDGEKAERAHVLKNKTAQSKWLEEGTYTVDKYPNAKPFSFGGGATNNTNGNVYNYKNKEMQGVFLVDEGRLVKYKHPTPVLKGGYKKQLFPPYMLASKNTNYTMPVCGPWGFGDIELNGDEDLDEMDICRLGGRR
ncbi:MAG: L,D-transpeptidase family protein [Bdellovibrionaceae bacterium]|jgi:uncharacterized protein YgiM (DUF1202 family)|nr:L,D-transpeptidase family protein [Pseudobdellovibrionaceae bacterium]